MVKLIKRMWRRAQPVAPAVHPPSLFHLRRANARRWLRQRGITHVKAVYASS
jgi:hypothetical protein